MQLSNDKVLLDTSSSDKHKMWSNIITIAYSSVLPKYSSSNAILCSHRVAREPVVPPTHIQSTSLPTCLCEGGVTNLE